VACHVHHLGVGAGTVGHAARRGSSKGKEEQEQAVAGEFAKIELQGRRPGGRELFLERGTGEGVSSATFSSKKFLQGGTKESVSGSRN